MTRKLVAALFSASLMAGCVTVDVTPPSGERPDRPDRPRGLAGEWSIKSDSTILTCDMVIEPGNGRGEGRARTRTCIGYDGLNFASRWERDDGRIVFFGIASEPLLVLRRVGRDELRGRLTRSDRRVVATRR